jgi:hypothetical protein
MQTVGIAAKQNNDLYRKRLERANLSDSRISRASVYSLFKGEVNVRNESVQKQHYDRSAFDNEHHAKSGGPIVGFGQAMELPSWSAYFKTSYDHQRFEI